MSSEAEARETEQETGRDHEDHSNYDQRNDSEVNRDDESSRPRRNYETEDIRNERDEIAGKIFIGGLSWQTTEETLRYYFSKYGELSDVALMMDKKTGKPRGFGFITMKDPKAADVVMEHDHTIDGRLIDVKRALPRDLAPGPASVKAEASKIFVGGLTQDVTEQDFLDYFSKFGTIKDAIVMMDRNTGSSRGFGFVTFDREDALEQVLRSDHELRGRRVEIKRAEPRESGGRFNDRGGHGDGYGGNRGGGDRYGGRGGGNRGGGYGGGRYGDRDGSVQGGGYGYGYGGYGGYGGQSQSSGGSRGGYPAAGGPTPGYGGSAPFRGGYPMPMPGYGYAGPPPPGPGMPYGYGGAGGYAGYGGAAGAYVPTGYGPGPAGPPSPDGKGLDQSALAGYAAALRQAGGAPQPNPNPQQGGPGPAPGQPQGYGYGYPPVPVPVPVPVHGGYSPVPAYFPPPMAVPYPGSLTPTGAAGSSGEAPPAQGHSGGGSGHSSGPSSHPSGGYGAYRANAGGQGRSDRSYKPY